MHKRMRLIHLGKLLLLSICVALGLNILLGLMEVAQYSERYQEVSAVLYAPPFWKQVFTGGLLIPIVEEILFRGLGFRLLRNKIGFLWAMLISALLFGLYHGNLVQFLYATICGMLLAYFCEKYQSVIAPILSHMAMNISAIVFTQWGFLLWVMERKVIGTLVMLNCVVLSVFLIRELQKMDVTKVLKIYCKEQSDVI